MPDPEQVNVQFPSGRVQAMLKVKETKHGDIQVTQLDGAFLRWVPQHWVMPPLEQMKERRDQSASI